MWARRLRLDIQCGVKMQKSQLTDFGSTYLENIAMMDNSLSLALRITCSLCTVYLVRSYYYYLLFLSIIIVLILLCSMYVV